MGWVFVAACGRPWWSSGEDSMLPTPGAQVLTLIGNSDPTYLTWACAPQLEMPVLLGN